MRKLAHFIYDVVKSGKPFDANYGLPILAFQNSIWPFDLYDHCEAASSPRAPNFKADRLLSKCNF